METNERVIHSLSVKRQTGRWNTDCAEYTSTYASALAYVCTQSTGVTVDADAHGSVKICPIRVIGVRFTLIGEYEKI